MSSSPADLAFARFCRTGDAEALAAVFDATAPRLAVLAGHLAPGDAATVDDLVQATFVEAIRSAPRFTPGRPVLPWLVTILGRRAARLRRERGVRRQVAGGDAVLDALVTDAPDPVRLAADGEVAAQVAAAIERLDAPYREVVALRLVHDLAPVEIARALGRPLGTVHAQWHRGAEKLRRMLPVGLAIAFAALLQAPSLAATRAAVLAAGRAAAVGAGAGAAMGAAAGGLVGVLIMKKILTGAAAVLLFALVGTWLWARRDGPAEPPGAGGPDAERVAVGVATEPIADADADADAAGVVTRRALRTDTAEPEVLFTGRIVAWETGLPLAGVQVRGEVRPHRAHLVAVAADRTPNETTTDTDGRYMLRVTPREDHLVTLLATAPGRATMAADFHHPLRPGATVDSGIVEMGLGAELTLRAIDADGATIQGVAIQLRGPDRGPSSTDGAFAAPGWGGLHTTDANGRTPPRSVLAGEHAVQWAQQTGHQVVGPDAIIVPGDRTALTVDLRFEAPHPDRSVRGTVVDIAGRPLIGVEIAAQQGGMFGMRTTRSFDGGRFHLPSIVATLGPVEIFRVGAGYGPDAAEYRIVEPDRLEFVAGTADVRLVVAPLARSMRRVRVLDGRDGAPLTRFRHGIAKVATSELGTAFGHLGDDGPTVGEPGDHPRGELDLATLEGVEHLLTIAPDQPGLAPVAFVAIPGATSASQPLEIRIPPAVTREVRVTDPAGVPVAGSMVDWLRDGGRPGARLGTIHSLDDVLRGRSSATFLTVSVATATTDTDGIARLTVSADPAGCRVRVRGAGHLDVVEAVDESLPVSAPLRVVVAPAAVLVGSIGPRELLGALGPSAAQRDAATSRIDPDAALDEYRAALRLDGRTTDGESVTRTVRLADDGSFDFTALPAGRYRLALSTPRVAGEPPDWDVGDLEVGAPREVALSLVDRAPALFQGRVTVDGEPPRTASVLRSGGRVIARPQPDGSFRALVWPGRHGITLDDGYAPRSGTELTWPSPLEFLAGERNSVDLDFQRRTVIVAVVDANGRPAAHRWLVVEPVGATPAGPRIVALDADGRVRIVGSWHESLLATLRTGPPFGPRASNPGAEAALGRIDPPPGPQAVEVVLRSPAVFAEDR